ncbi:hypothetical protein Leryth_006898 [Lithospermum erythrorhizon]|nr:hypothetical protein Leryth_006898 [Lithospermum erythrorhizon]
MARSKSEEEQWMVESQVLGIYHSFFNLPPQAQSANLELQRDDHMEYLTKGLRRLGPSFTSLDAKYWQWQRYTFCGLAAMVLINEVHRLDLPRLINWLVFRQGIEGGFQGRTNKLVDGCYSFWQGGAAAIIQRLNSIINKQLGLEDVEEESEDSGEGLTSLDLSEGVCNERASTHNEETSHLSQQGHGDTCDGASLSKFGFNFISRCGLIKPFFEPKCLQQYILLCSQVKGGFRDKPGKNRDHYHTCYCLSGLSISQYSEIKEADYPPLARDLLGSYSNLLEQVHPLYNIVVEKYHEAREFFSALQENV